MFGNDYRPYGLCIATLDHYRESQKDSLCRSCLASRGLPADGLRAPCRPAAGPGARLGPARAGDPEAAPRGC